MTLQSKIIILLATLSLLYSCTEGGNPLILNKDLYSIEPEHEKARKSLLPTMEKQPDQPTGNTKGTSHQGRDKSDQKMTLFKPQFGKRTDAQHMPQYRKQGQKQKILEQERPPVSHAANVGKKLKSSARQLNTNGSIPIISVTANASHPQAVDEKGRVQPPDAIVQLDYEQVELRQILEDLADALGMTIVIDPSITGRLTMRTSPNQPLRNKDLWSVLNLLMNEAGITLEKKAGLYYAKRNPQTLPANMGYPSVLQADDAALALQITPLKYISADAAITALKPLLGTKSRIQTMGNLNMLAITAAPEQLQRVNGLIRLIDSDPFKYRGIRLYKIREADVKKVADELEDILKLIEGDNSSYKVMGLERISALLVVAPPRRGFETVDRWVQILDEGTDQALQEQIFIYNCKSVKCDKLANTLNSIFNQSNKKATSKKNQQDNKPNVFRKVPKDALNIKKKNKTAKTTRKKKTVKPDKRAQNSADINVVIVADEDTNSLAIRSTGRDYKTLLQTIQLLDRTPLQVLINVVIAQVSLKKGQSLGLDWKFSDGTTLLQNNLGKASEVVDGKPLGLVWSATNNHFTASLNALASAGDVNILSRPSLLIANNQEGVINVGKEVPVQTSQTTNLNASVIGGDTTTPTNGTQVTQEIAYRNTGIELTVTPHINEDGVVNLEIKQSLSAIEGSTTSQDAAFKPTFSNQDINTVAVVADGETIVLGGLIDSVTTYKDSGIPFLKDIPLAGYLFKTTEESEDRRELMLIITPRVIGPNTDLNRFGNEFASRFKAVSRYLQNVLQDSY